MTDRFKKAIIMKKLEESIELLQKRYKCKRWENKDMDRLYFQNHHGWAGDWNACKAWIDLKTMKSGVKIEEHALEDSLRLPLMRRMLETLKVYARYLTYCNHVLEKKEVKKKVRKVQHPRANGKANGKVDVSDGIKGDSEDDLPF